MDRQAAKQMDGLTFIVIPSELSKKYFSLFFGLFSHPLELETKCQDMVHTNVIIIRK